jgi:septum site-determining protein MinC
LLADGNIHVYGPLRGRALAGVQGNTQARIFCRTLEAELVAIAGYYLVKEDMHNLPNQESTVQIFLDNDQVRIESV